MSDFWKIVGRHSKHWNYPKKETIELLQTYIDQQVTKGSIYELEELSDKFSKLYVVKHNEVNPGDTTEVAIPLNYILDRLSVLKGRADNDQQ